jgi:hypothetical protein
VTFGSASSTGDATATDSTGDPSGSESGDAEGESSSGDGPEPIDCGAMMQCGQSCVDVQSDAANCGACGVSCVIANAEAMCAAGECAMGACLPGFSDCDGDLANGCEAMADCSAGAPCQTSCGSTGMTACSATCEPVCNALVESCNAVDDDCNASCDEGPIAGCRLGVHRSNGPLGHFYTTDLMEAQSGGMTLEAQDYYFLYVAEAEGLVALNRCLRPNGKRFYTASATCEDAAMLESALGFMAPDERCGSIPLFRLYHSGNDAHFYTTSAAERDNAVNNLGWTYESIVGYVWSGA